MTNKCIVDYGNSSEEAWQNIKELAGYPLERDVKQRVLSYLNNADFISAGVLLDSPINAFTTLPMDDATGTWFSDGKWHWQDTLRIYVKDYDVKLPEEFIDDVNKFFDEGGKTKQRRNPKIGLMLMQDPDYQMRLQAKRKELHELRQRGMSTQELWDEFFDAETETFLAKMKNNQSTVNIEN